MAELQRAALAAYDKIICERGEVTSLDMFIAGRDWQKEQMIQDAIGATALNSDYPTRLELNTKLNNVNAMDEVKVIIIKE